MNLRTEILKEHSKKQTVKIVRYIGSNQKRFDALIKLFLSNEYRVTQRAAWAVSYCAEAHPQLIEKHLGKIIRNLRKPVHVAVKRNTVRLLQDIPVPEKLEGALTDACFIFLVSAHEPIAVKVFSMTILKNLCKKHPELIPELKYHIEMQLPYASAGFISRARKVLMELGKI